MADPPSHVDETTQLTVKSRIEATALQVSKGLLGSTRIHQIVEDVWSTMTPQQQATADANSGSWMARVEAEVQQAQGLKPLNESAATPAEIAAQARLAGISQFASWGDARLSNRDSGGGGGSGSSSADTRRSYSDLPGGWTTEKLQHFAREAGVPWVANNHELLRLGPAAIQTLADVHMREESYRRLTKEAGFDAKGAVTIAKHAKDNNIDANALSNSIADANQGLADAEKRKHNEALINYMQAKPEDKENARKRLHDVQDNIVKDHPAHKQKFEQMNGLVEQKKAEGAASKADADKKVEAASDTLAGLNAPVAASSPAPARPSQKPAEGGKAAAKYAGGPHPAG